MTRIGLYSVLTTRKLEGADTIQVRTHQNVRSTHPGLEAQAATAPTPASHCALTSELHRRTFAAAPTRIRRRAIDNAQRRQLLRQTTAQAAEQGPGVLRARRGQRRKQASSTRSASSPRVKMPAALVEEPTRTRHCGRSAARAPATSSPRRRDAIECDTRQRVARHVSELRFRYPGNRPDC